MTKTVNADNFEAWIEYLRTTENLRVCKLDWVHYQSTDELPTEFQKDLPSSENEPEALSLKITTFFSFTLATHRNFPESLRSQCESFYKIEIAKILTSLIENPCIEELSLGMS